MADSQKFPSQKIPTPKRIWQTSSGLKYCLHRQENEEYLKEQETAADAIQEQLESNPDYQAEIAELRPRVLAGGLQLKRTALQRSFMARFELC